ncbi:MAG: hypothetical protein Q4D90_02460 [bacterium]|nr:hypothetical protein [bacterium]
MSKRCYHEEKGTNFNELRGGKPDPNCTCDVGTTGPAAEIKKEDKVTGSCYHNEKGVTFNDLRGVKPDPNCTCDVGTTGPAAEIEK